MKVYARLVKAGLGNKLFVWAKAVVFTHLNDAELHTSKWWDFHPGVYLRNLKKEQKDMRFYWRLFRKDGFSLKLRFLYYRIVNKKVIEPALAQEVIHSSNVLYVFNQIPKYDFFADIKPFRDLLKEKIYDNINKKHVEQINSKSQPILGVHIRRGDFNSTFRTPLQSFVQTICKIRAFISCDIPVTVFSDGYDHELEELLSLPNTIRATWNPPIVDMLLLSRSKIIVMSNHSTFSYWAGFLSDAVIIKHTEDQSATIRPESINMKAYEGKLPEHERDWSSLLKRNLLEVNQ